MARSVLVVASQTATSPQLIEALQARAGEGDAHLTLLMPASGIGYTAKEQTQETLEAALETWRENGLADADGVVGDADPLVAVHETWDPLRHDEIIVSTLPGHASKWLRSDLPHRVARLTDADGVVGDADPLVAVHETWDPLRHDEIIVSTLPGNVSRWLQADLPHRIARLTDAQVTHVLSSTPQAPIAWEQAPPKERPSLGPLSVLAWGRPKDETDAERERRLRARGRAGTP